ncbi:ATP-binding protein [Thalassospiraceae bacterium LMO-JJ14]|nr:ATP-binding protein [Thalassospiraceae bacterium LMO-JJ14]
MKSAEGLKDRRLFTRMVQHMVLVPVVVFVLLLSATGYVWLEVKKYHLAQQVSDANRSLEFVSAHLEAHLDVRLVIGELIRQEWLDSYLHTPEAFTAIVNSKLQRFMDFQAINWVSADGVIRWVNPLQGNEGALGLDIRKLAVPNAALRNAERTGVPQITAPFELAQGGRGFVIYVPVIDGGSITGFINMVFRAEAFIRSALPVDGKQDFDLHIYDGDKLVYENHKATHIIEPHLKSFAVGTRTWTISTAPTVLSRSDYSTASNNLILLFGLVFSLLLPLILFQLLRRNAELRATQRRLADFADISSDWFWETDNKLRFSYFSSRFEEVSGVEPVRFIGKTREEVGAPEADPYQYQAMLDNMQHRLPFRDFEHSRIKPNGIKTYISISGRPAYDENGDFIGYRGVGQDITERRTNQKALNDALVASEEANRAKSEFLATMSHEFRTPLNAIIGFSEMLKEEYFGKLGAQNYLDYAADIHRSGKHMLDLVNDILDFSAIEASKRQMLMENFSFAGILRDGIRNVETQAQQKNLTLNQDLPADLPDVHADKRSVYQIVLNLLSNAVKFTEPGGSVTVEASYDDKNFSFSVSDTGIGIATENLATITEPFSQTHSNPHIAGTGTGLGLTIVKSLVEAHSGRLSIESAPGVGTRVTVTLPRQNV